MSVMLCLGWTLFLVLRDTGIFAIAFLIRTEYEFSPDDEEDVPHIMIKHVCVYWHLSFLFYTHTFYFII